LKCGNIQNNGLTPDKELNILTHEMPSCVIIEVINFQKWSTFLGPQCIKIAFEVKDYRKTSPESIHC